MGCLAILTPWRGSRKPILMVLCGAWVSGAPQWSSSEQLPEEWDLLVSAPAARSSSSRDARGAEVSARRWGDQGRVRSPRCPPGARLASGSDTR